MTAGKTAAFPAHPVLALPFPLLPPPIEDGWKVGPPDFVGIGAMRSGTTWWWSVLKRHSGIAANSGVTAHGGDGDHDRIRDATAYINKEFHFFDHFGQVETVDPAQYHRYFPRPPGALAGEWTPRYLYDFWTPPMLYSVAPQTKVLVLLRDPVDRFVSGIARFTSMGITADPALYNDQFARGLYWQQLRNVLSYFPPEQVLVLQYEQCGQDFIAQAERTFAFLGLDPAAWDRPADPHAPVGIVTDGAGVVNAETLAAVRRAYQADTRCLLADFPRLDGALWTSTLG
ncbi:MAG TPA: sulfotransferase domain-containing protein [Pseudonocardiaceae bacterium]|nr:sulfotransferase domain-containing protein [Pseudonocardiaceae bacterium]